MQEESISAILLSNLITEHRSRARHVERVDMALHRDRHDAIAMFEDVSADPLPLAAYHERDLACEIDLLRVIAVRRRAVDPVTLLFQRLDRAREIRDLGDRHPLRRTGTGLYSRGRQTDALMVRNHNHVHAEPVG